MLKALHQQNFHPQVILGSADYSHQLIPNSGGAAAVNGALVDQDTSLFLGEDAASIPAVVQFDKWVQIASPGFHPDRFTLYGWLSAQLFTQALKHAGSNPSRGSLLEALGTITSFNGNNLVTTANPAAKKVSNCYLLGKVANGIYQRIDDPPVSSGTHGYRCDDSYVVPPRS